MDKKLLAELLKSNDSLQNITFEINGKKFDIYYKYLTIFEKVRIEQMSVRAKTIINSDGSKTVEYEKNDELIPIHTILEKGLDKDGKRLFSHTNKDDFDLIKNLPSGIGSYIAYQMSTDIMGTMKGDEDGK